MIEIWHQIKFYNKLINSQFSFRNFKSRSDVFSQTQKEFAYLVHNPIDGFAISLTDDFDMYHWQGAIFGPENSVYEGGIFHLDIKIPGEYPMNPPKCTFTTKIYHPNIDFDGRISLGILQCFWSPALQIRTALRSILSLLTSPNFDDPMVASISDIHRKNPAEFEAIAREWTQKYAI